MPKIGNCQLLTDNSSILQYLEIKITLPADFTEFIMAELSSIGYDSFMEIPEGLNAYVDETLFSDSELRDTLAKYIPSESFSYIISKLENKNWNEEWEKNFQPVIIDDQFVVKASFHKLDKEYPYEVIINPKMSFGTGHHETTHMMVQHQLEVNHTNKRVIDAGSGTGILAIMAEKLGANEVIAYDIEDWAFENLKENINLNGCSKIKVAQGDVETVDFPFKSCDIVLANINKNVLLKEIPVYSNFLSPGGILIISGFYVEDVQDIENVCKASSLKTISQKERNRWTSLVLQKI